MKRIILFLTFIFTALGCTPESISTSNKSDDIFFVRYVSDKPGAIVYYTNELGENIRTTGAAGNGVFERIVGPVYKGFQCSFRMDNGTGINNQPLRIEVKRNDEPFVVKVEGTASVKYTIE